MPQQILVKVPFSYTVHHIPKGKRNPVEYEVLDEAVVSVEGLTSKEAPDGLKFKPNGWRATEKTVGHPWWNGRLWQPWSRVPSGAEDRAMTIDELMAVLEGTRTGSDDYYSPFGLAPRKPYGKEFIMPGGLPPGRTRDSGEAERAEKLTTMARRAAEIILVDGKVFTPATEPVYNLTQASGWGSSRKTEEPVLYLRTISAEEVNAHTSPGSYWRVDRLDEAIAELMEDENRRRSHYGHDPLSAEQIRKRCVWSPVEVLIPECVRFRYDMRPRVDIAVREAFDAMKKHLEEADEGYFAIYARFRALVRAEPRDYETIVAVIRDEVAPALEANDGQHVAGRMNAMVEEWINRDDPAAIRETDLEEIASI